MLKKWILRDASSQPDPGAFDGLPPLAAALLSRRGIVKADEVSSFLNPSLSGLGDPLRISGVPAAVERLRRAVSSREKILIYGDYDVDGSAGSAILYLALRRLGAAVEAFIPDRIRQGYGLKRPALEEAVAGGVSLLVSVDNGITGHQEIAFLNLKRVDTVVVDHHKSKKDLPPARVIVGVGADGDPETDLTASGLSFMLARALLADDAEALRHLDLAALGTIADLAPLRGANRSLARLGLERLAATDKPGLRALLRICGIERPTADDVAFQLAPRLNAAGRVGASKDAFTALVTENPIEADNLAAILDQANRERQRMEQETFAEALAQVEAGHHFGKEPVIVVADKRWHEGIVGIIASRLVERYHRPSYAIALRNGVGKGSGRSIRGFLMFETMMKCPHLFEQFGGHQAACGLTIREERVPEFRRVINDLARERIPAGELVPRLEIDAEIALEALDRGLTEAIGLLEPYGMGNARPTFLTRGLRVKCVSRAGRQGAALTVADEGGREAEALFFRMRPVFREGQRIDVVYSPMKRGDGRVTLAVEDADFAKEAVK